MPRADISPIAIESKNWDRKVQNIIIRVEDTSGQGGIWKPVWLVSK
jgi:hypothetical protein